MSITHNIQNHFIIMASHLNTSRATEILYTILELANIELQNVFIEKNSMWPYFAVFVRFVPSKLHPSAVGWWLAAFQGAQSGQEAPGYSF